MSISEVNEIKSCSEAIWAHVNLGQDMRPTSSILYWDNSSLPHRNLGVNIASKCKKNKTCRVGNIKASRKSIGRKYD